MKNVLYIGNQLKHNKATVTSVDTLGVFLKKEGFNVRIASSKKSKILRLFDMCYSVFKYKNETDVVLIDTYSTTNFYYALAVAWCCKKINKPYIPILHGGNLPKRLKNDKRKSSFLFNGAYINVSPSGFLKQQFENYGFKKVVCIPNTIELKEYSFYERAMAPTILWVRSFSKIYNPLLALKVLEKVSVEFPNASLCMVGPEKDGSLAECRKYAEEKELQVEFTGKLSKPEWIQLSNKYSVFINTTNFDNTPVSVIEAMALGLPVVSTNVGGIPYLLTHQEDALLVKPNDVEALANSVLYLLNNPKTATKIASNARLKAEGFDWEQVKLKWLDILK